MACRCQPAIFYVLLRLCNVSPVDGDSGNNSRDITQVKKMTITEEVLLLNVIHLKSVVVKVGNYLCDRLDTVEVE